MFCAVLWAEEKEEEEEEEEWSPARWGECSNRRYGADRRRAARRLVWVEKFILARAAGSGAGRSRAEAFPFQVSHFSWQ